ncbi:uncharacterized protein LOC123981097 [Micropterus dolomieu]|uniref:uncharacterized protein LOC123981097 n=1 Tax=Micropterus dolomieu TaxID=147949 RepID=UPI001E8E54D3|nr:uncharacterized protein LOC123981097 [Micropterus dolomieu]
MFQSLDFFVLSCLFLSAESDAGQILRPQNVSLQWKSDFEPLLTWAPPQHSGENCTYTVSKRTWTKSPEEIYIEQTAPWSTYTVMEGGFLEVSVEAVCSGGVTVFLNHTSPVLVRNLNCIYSSKKSHCSWTPVSHTPDLAFFYRLQNEDQTTEADDDTLSPLKECSSYNYAAGVRTGCDLQADIKHAIHLLFNGTQKNMTVRNTFRRVLLENVRPSALEWNVTKNGSQLNISWIPPDIIDLSQWKFIINYTECDQIKVKTVDGDLSIQVKLVSHCRYRMAIKAQTTGAIQAETPWSDEKYFDADTDPNALVYAAAIIIPLMFAGLAVLTFMCCRKNKEKIFPKVPEPRDLISDISDNNNKSNVCNLYIPAVEEDNCKITLVIDPHSNLI